MEGWEVMHACLIMHNIIIESECGDPYDHQGSLAVVDHKLPIEFANCSVMH
jgi:hypothetical protein